MNPNEMINYMDKVLAKIEETPDARAERIEEARIDRLERREEERSDYQNSMIDAGMCGSDFL